ncbi:MAG: hypothetical protein ABI847_15255 [Anaerolineales bacterium]
MPIERIYFALFNLFVLIMGAVFVFLLRLGIMRVEQLPEYTQDEKAIIRKQMKALYLLPVFMFVLIDFPGWLNSIAAAIQLFLALAIGFGMIAYVAISSIKNRISMFREHGKPPTRGRTAVWGGIINLGLVLVAWSGGLYFIVQLLTRH